jgi:superfamily II DNA or RNA helicase/very-short-patch-repair endonuclease
MNRPDQPIDRHSSPAAKIALFRSLFRGRPDIYARRFVSSKTGGSGYAPACGNEWAPGVCEKPRIKCAVCPQQRFLQVSDDVIRWHLSGHDDGGRDFVMAIYPVLRDETCFFLALDLDKRDWQEDSQAVLDSCRRLSLPAALERSRSGGGGRLWLFFAEAVPATLARQLGAHLLTETMERRPEIGLDSYDRFFPSQDTLPHGSFGSLIALPLQKGPRELGNSVFLDDRLQPFADQWALLSTLRKIDRSTVETIVSDAGRRGRIVGVRLASTDEDAEPQAGPLCRRQALPIVQGLPQRLQFILSDRIYIAKEQLPPALLNRLIRLAAFQNPEFFKAQAMRLPTYGKPRIIACADDDAGHIALPRGCLDDVQSLLADLGVDVALQDERHPGRPLPGVEFQGQLHAEQDVAANAMLAHDTGVLSATTAFGKTVVAAWLIAKRGVNALVLVHRRQLVAQWAQRLTAFLNIPAKSIGRIGGGRNKPTGLLDVALIQSLSRKGLSEALVGDYGHVIVDECHHLAAPSFEQVVRRAKAKFVTGLSATVTRQDGHHPIILMQCGPVRHRVDARNQADSRPFEHTVHVRPTSFRSSASADNPRSQFQELNSELTRDQARNQLICDEVLEAVRDGRSPLLVTERNEHLDCLAERLLSNVQHLIVLRGGMSGKEVGNVMNQLAAIPEGESRVLLATGRYIGEGFDDARLDTLFLALPVSWRGTIAQYVGRLHRAHQHKREVRVFDYADLNVPMLARMFDRRCRGYEAVGYRILLPASAVPGWPAEVPLPVDPQWKRDYAASVQRLIRDGVDTPLANLFTHTARPFSPDAEGADRARSATEAFLFRRLLTLPQTAGRFQLNAELPIPFDGNGRMEVDLVHDEARVSIELDGPHHLASLEAYRRDRRKDLLLQQNGYTVLRFLVEDVAGRLDVVLDAILSTLAWRERVRVDCD